MTREEEALQAAADTFKVCSSEFDKAIEMLWIEAFIAGVDYADRHPKNVWHPADEEPERRNGCILCEHDLYYWVATQPYLSSIYGNWHKKVKREHLIRWAYIRDLLPKGGEE